MTQEEKSLLLQDLCARLPYGVICTDSLHDDSRITDIDIVDETVYCYDFYEYVGLDKIKPYLRPMSSMTEEEKQWSRWYQQDAKSDDFRLYMCRYVEWLDSNHFDWRTDSNGKTLIEKGLALEAQKGMYKKGE